MAYTAIFFYIYLFFRKKPVCQLYKSKTGCWTECGKLHKLIFCKDFQNNSCSRDFKCPYIHLGFREELEYERSGVLTTSIRRELDRAFQYPSQICNCKNDSGTSCCNRRVIDRPQANAEFLASCPICFEPLSSGHSVVLNKCRHVFCNSCINALVTDFLNSAERGLDTTANQCALCKTVFVEEQEWFFQVIH